MKKLLTLLFAGALLHNESAAQFTRFIVTFKHKGATTFSLASPSAYLSPRAIARRTKYGIAVDSSDLPVPASFIDQVRSIPGVTVLNVSKWLNAVTIDTTDPGALAAINALPFVQTSAGIAARQNPGRPAKPKTETGMPAGGEQGRLQGLQGDFYNYGTGSFNEIHLHNGEFLHNIGLRGQGMQIAMLDGGFFHYNSLRAFDSINLNGQVLGTWDFVAGDASVAEDNSHGMMCLSTIAANIPGQFVGKAPKAGFYLYRTEDPPTEQRIEEFNWACGAEKADSAGADVISTSVGYYIDFTPPSTDHPYSDMNGDITPCAIAGDLAAKKGMLVFASVGNDGNETVTKFLSTPSDGDSVVAVGAVNTAGLVAGFSSYGPSADGRVKPDVVSVGVGSVVQNTNNTVGTNNGTSFSCPIMAGMATCLWQGFPEFNNMRIVRALQEAGSKFNSPDNRVGYGIPNLKSAFGRLLGEFTSSSATLNSCNATINWTSKDVEGMRYEIERKAPGESAFTKIGEINAPAGQLLATHDFSFAHSLGNVPAGTVSFRIRQVIDSSAGGFTAVYIDTATISLATGCTATGTNDPNASGETVFVMPNPTPADATLVVDTPNPVNLLSISVFDVKGRLVAHMKKSKGAGRASFTLPVNKMLPGKYIVAVYDNQRLVGTADLIRL